MNEEIVTTDGLTKFYGKICGIDKISIRVPKGGVGFLGPNGAGKTTIIRTLLGIIRPTKGDANVLGYSIKSEINHVRDQIGYIPEFNTAFIPEMTAMKFVAFCARMNGLSYSESKQRASDSLYYVGLGEERYRSLGSFSLGMKQKVKLAIALVHDPEIVIADEPTNGLDPNGRNQMLELIRNLQKDHQKNIILSSHLLRDVEQTTNYAFVFSKGTILAQGRIKELTSKQDSSVSVKIKGSADIFLKELNIRGYDAWTGNNYIEVKKVPDIEKIVFQLAYELGMEVRYLGSRSNTLEEVFVDLFKNKEVLVND
ncbi:MAG: ABC transporter ATP-binding protein [Candidatus Hodarchaeales archaeon]